MGQIGKQESGGQAKTQETLEAFEAHYSALQVQPSTRPLDEQALVLALHSPFGAVGAHRREPQQGIERETSQSSGVDAKAQIPLGDQGLPEQRQSQGTHG